MAQILKETLPQGMSFEWTELAYQQQTGSGTALLVFPLVVLFVFLVLAAQYESFTLPLAIILIVPVALLAGLVGVLIQGGDSNVFTQVGLLVLVALASKNAILIVEFAKHLQEDQKLPPMQAVLEAARLRLRPILMTSIAFIMGVVPLVLAHGAGAEVRRAMGATVFAGMRSAAPPRRRTTPPPARCCPRRLLLWRAVMANRTVSSTLVAAVAAILAGCAVGPNYREPTLELPQKFDSAETTAYSATDADVARFWTVFGDQQLDQLVTRALYTNHDLRIALARLNEARALRGAARLDLGPTISAGAGYTDQRLSESQAGSGPRNISGYDASFDAFWELDLFGRARRALEASNAQLQAAEASLGDVEVSVVAELSRSYFELRGDQQRLAVAQRNVANQTETLALTQARLEGGAGTELDTARATAQLAATRASIAPLQAAVARAIHRIGVLSGLAPDALRAQLELPGDLPAVPEITAVADPAQLLRRRPDIRVSERELAASTARIGVAVADLFPRVTFTGSVGVAAGSLGGLNDSGNGAHFIGPGISWAAFDLGHVRARIAAARARGEGALAGYEQTVLRALQETEDALVTHARSRDRLRDLTQAAEASQTAARLARLRYENGAVDFLQVLDAERSLLQIQDSLAQSRADTATSLVAVYKALGGGWVAPATGG
jgi:multidrug efflux system outer membrane protein